VQQSHWPQPMELDATHKGNGSKTPKSEMDQCRRKKLCFTCGAAGHQSKFHQQKKGVKKNFLKKKGGTHELDAAEWGETPKVSELCVTLNEWDILGQKEENSNIDADDTSYYDVAEESGELSEMTD